MKSIRLSPKKLLTIFLICLAVFIISVIILSFTMPLRYKLPNNYYLKQNYWKPYFILYSSEQKKEIENVYKIGYCEKMIYGAVNKPETDVFLYFVLNTENNHLEYPYKNFDNSRYFTKPMATFSDLELEYDYDIAKIGLDKCD